MNKLIKSVKFTAGIAMLAGAAISLGAVAAAIMLSYAGSTAPVCGIMALGPIPTLLLAFAGISTLDSLK